MHGTGTKLTKMIVMLGHFLKIIIGCSLVSVWLDQVQKCCYGGHTNLWWSKCLGFHFLLWFNLHLYLQGAVLNVIWRAWLAVSAASNHGCEARGSREIRRKVNTRWSLLSLSSTHVGNLLASLLSLSLSLSLSLCLEYDVCILCPGNLARFYLQVVWMIVLSSWPCW